MIHLENIGFTIKDAKDLLNKARSICMNNAIVRDVRVANKHIEFDVSMERDREEQILNRLREIAPLKRCVEIVEKDMSKDESIEYARELFNAERYWEAHEVLEGIWKESNGDEKEVIQGIILLAAAFVHLQRGEEDVAYSILKRAIPKLSMNINGMDIISIKSMVEDMLINRKIRSFQI